MANFLRQIVIERVSANEGETEQLLILHSIVEGCTIGSVNCMATLYEIVFANEMYSPSHLTVKFNLVPEGENLPAYQDIVKFFLLAKVTIKRTKQSLETTGAETTEIIDSNYYVHEVRPTYVNNIKNKEKKVVLYLDIFSSDKLLTLDKYSKSYVHKSLYGDIIEPEAVKILKNTKTEGITVSTKDFSSRLKYTESNNTTAEIKHPYLVQYNESFYDFLIRTANRTGEFLYFADGCLTLGVNAGAVVTTVENYFSLAVESRNNSVLTTVGISRNYAGKTHKKSSSALCYTQPTSNDDYLMVYEKDSFDSYSNEYKLGWRHLPAAFKALFTSPTIGAFVKALVVDLAAIESGQALYRAYKVNDAYNKSAIENAKGKVADGSKAVFSGTYRDGSTPINNWYVNANADFYNKIDECEKKMGSRTITLTLYGDDATNYKVGQFIEVEGSRYVVTHVKYSEIFDGYTLRQEYVIKALPLLKVKFKADTHEAELMLTDEDSSPEQSIFICCPPALPEEQRIRKAASQTAWVVDSDDPKYLGRVRIRYAWDEAGVDSPWIRQAEPAAGKEGGVNFRLYEEDEVMIGYENDNIEQPYIIGALYHGEDNGTKNNVPVGRNKYVQNTHLIRNRSGHQMVISEQKNNGAFFARLQPGLAYLTPVAKTIFSALGAEDGVSTMAGGIQFTDKYGIYNVSMSSDQRLISIASPMGNIKLSAFSGISISAPRGDISISGKNVSIKAANKLTLESGSNAKNTEFKKTWHDSSAGAAIGNSIAPGIVGGITNWLSSLVDMSLLRHTVECFVPPVDGTLQIKSHRYLLLEAGKGTAHIPQDGFQDAVTAEKDLGSYNKYYGGSNKVVKMKIHIEKLAGIVTQRIREYRVLLGNVYRAAEKYQSDIPRLNILNFNLNYPDVNAAYNNLKNHAGEKKFKNSFLFGQDVREDLPILGPANAYWNAIKELDRFVNSKEKWAVLPYLKEGELGIAFTKAQNKLKEIFKEEICIPKDYDQIVEYIETIDSLEMIRSIKSEVIFAYLTTLRDYKPVSILEGSDEGLTNHCPLDANSWIKFMDKLQFHTPEGHSLEKVFGETNDNFITNTKKNVDFWSTSAENKNWGYDRAKYGRILFSDQDNNTYYVDSNGKKIESKPNPNIGDVRDLILELLK